MNLAKLYCLGKKSYGQFLNFSLFLFLTTIYMLTGKITIKQIMSLSYAEFSREYEMRPCQAVSLGENSYETKCKTVFCAACCLLEPRRRAWHPP